MSLLLKSFVGIRRIETTCLNYIRKYQLTTKHQQLMQNEKSFHTNIPNFASKLGSVARFRAVYSENKSLKYIAIGTAVMVVLFTDDIWKLFKKEIEPNKFIKLDNDAYSLKEQPPTPDKLASSFQNPEDKTGLKITLYQYTTCPFCCKVRAILDYYGLSYDIVEVNSVTRSQTKWTPYKKVPFMVLQKEGSKDIYQLKDSSMIISAVESIISNKEQSVSDILKAYPILTSNDENGKPVDEILNRYSIIHGDISPKSNEEILKEKKWRKWVDDVYVHTLSPNVYRTYDEAQQAFSWFSKAGRWEELFSTWERLLVMNVGSFVMYFIGKRLKKKYNLTEDVRISFYEETNLWLCALKKNQTDFMGGSQPNLSDLSLYGVLTAIEGCDAFADLLDNTKIKPWFNRMQRAVGNHEGSKYLS